MLSWLVVLKVQTKETFKGGGGGGGR